MSAGAAAAAATADRKAVWRWSWPGALLVAALLGGWLVGLGTAPLFDVDEGAFAEASREMLVGGDWLHTTLNGADRFDKPILVYWLQAASLALFGGGEFAVRLPSALCAFAWCLAVAHFAAPRWGAAAAVLAAGMLATCAGPALIGRAATADALLNLLLTLAVFDLWRFVESDGRSPPELRRAAVWIGLGLLAKGPVAVVIPAAALAAWLLTLPWRRAGRLLRAMLTDAAAWALLVAVALPWYAYALWRHGGAFVDGFFVRHNLERFSGPLEGHGGGALYYLVVLPLLMLPWTPVLWPVLRRLRQDWQAEAPRFLLLWAAFVIGFFSLSGTKLPHYVLYGIVPLVLLGARALVEGGRGAALAVVGCSGLLVGVAASSPTLPAWLAARVADPHWRERLGAPPLHADGTWSAPAVALLAIAALAVWALRTQRGAWRPALAAAVVGVGCAVLLALPAWGERLQGPVRDLARLAAQRGLPLVQWQLHQPSAGFYRQAPAPRREPLPGEAALSRSDRFDALPPARQAAFEELARRPGFVLVLRRHPTP